MWNREQRPRIKIPKDSAINETRVYVGAIESKGFLFSVTPREWLGRGSRVYVGLNSKDKIKSLYYISISFITFLPSQTVQASESVNRAGRQKDTEQSSTNVFLSWFGSSNQMSPQCSQNMLCKRISPLPSQRIGAGQRVTFGNAIKVLFLLSLLSILCTQRNIQVSYGLILMSAPPSSRPA